MIILRIVLLKFLIENTVLALALLCIPCSGVFLILQRKQLRLNTWWKLLFAPILYVVLGLLSLALFSILHDIRTWPHWSIHHQGLLLVFPLFFPLVAKLLKQDWLDVSDALAVSIPGIIAILRIFCLVTGCCYGGFIYGTSIRWPIREMAMLLNFVFSIVFYLWNRHDHTKGIILPTYLILYGAYRSLEVLLRSRDYSLTNFEDYLFSLISALIGIFWFMWIDEKKRRQKKASKKHSYTTHPRAETR